MTSFISKVLFIALFYCTALVTSHAQANFDLVIIFKPATTWADITTFKAQLRATQLDSTLPSGAKLWRCSIPLGTTITLPNAPSLGGVSSGLVNQPSDAVGVICNTGSSDGVSLNGLYIIPENDRPQESFTTPPPLFGSCPTPATDSIVTVRGGDRALKIAILDSGIDCDAEGANIRIPHDSIRPYICFGRDSLNKRDDDLNGYVDDLIGYDFVNNSGLPKDSTGHGTFVTGVVTRILKRNQSNNVKIFVLKVLNQQNRGFEYDIIRAIDYALKMKVEVINCSFISSTPLADTSDLPLTSAIATAQRFGALVSIAAGNNGKDIDQTANLFGAAVFQNPNTIVTGATSCLDSTAFFSNFAKRNVDIMTPAKNMVSTWVRTPICSTNCYAYYSGTSFAAPQTTAVAALLSSNLSGADWQKVKCTILKSATYRPFLVNKNRRSGTLNGLAAFNRLSLTNTPCDDIINSTTTILENITTFKASPNPFSTVVNVDFSLKETTAVQLSVFNSTGQRVVNQSVIGLTGENKYPLSIEATSGVFIIQIQAGKDVVNQKVVKF
jgi:Subtilase family/Secretion system C-terminal sorting domain